MRAAAIIVAAGSGARFGGSLPKQYLPLAGRPVLAHAIDRFVRSGAVERLVLVLADPDEARRHLGDLPGSLPIEVVAGGADRQASVASGLERVGSCDLVLVHDGVRPLVPPGVIVAVSEAAQRAGAAIAGRACPDTVKETAGGRVVGTLDRSRLVLALTPQGFHTELLRRAHRAADRDGVRATDDAALVERLGLPVEIVDCPAVNLKITGPGDLELAECLMRRAAGPAP